jgi:uncharacterized protein DUF3467
MDEEKPIPTQQGSPDAAAIQQFFEQLMNRIEQGKKGTNAVYANNAMFEVSAWDLKILFGQLDQQPEKSRIDWHTSVTMPWMQAKIFMYYLRLNIAYYEMHFTPVNTPERVIPALPAPPAEADAKAHVLFETYKKIHAEIFGS